MSIIFSLKSHVRLLTVEAVAAIEEPLRSNKIEDKKRNNNYQDSLS